MKEKIVKDGTKVILFALDTEDTSVTGVITGHWSTMDGIMYECHYTELDGISTIFKEEISRLYQISSLTHSKQWYRGQVKLLVLRTNSATFAVVFPQCSMVKPEEGTIVSAMVLAAAKEKGRTDVASRLCQRERIHSIRSRIRKIKKLTLNNSSK